MFFPPSGVLGFDVAFVAFGDEEALSGPPRHSRLSRLMQSYSSSSNTQKKDGVAPMFQHSTNRCWSPADQLSAPSLPPPPPFFFLLLSYFSRQRLSPPCQFQLWLTSPRVSTSCLLCQVGPTPTRPVETQRGAGGRPALGARLPQL